MKKRDAQDEAHRRWSRRNGISRQLGDRHGSATLRRKIHPKRYIVGYIEIVSLYPEQWQSVTMGAGDSWEEAFSEADAKERSQ